MPPQAAPAARTARAQAQAIKFAPGSDTRLRVLAIPFGGPAELGNRDLDGEYFSAKTDLCADWYPVQRPLLYHHGLHPDTDTQPVGKVDSTTAAVEDEVGVWVEAELDKQAQYYEHLRRMIEREAMYASSGSLPHLVRKAKDGHIDRWPWIELSLTPTPANPLARVSVAEAKAHYKAAGITPPPTIDEDDARPYAELLDRLTDDSGEFLDLTRRLAEGRLKVGRALSKRRREQLLALAVQWESGATDLRQIVAEAETAPRAEAREDGDADAPSGAAPAQEQTPQTQEQQPGDPGGDGGEGKATAHAPDDLKSIFRKFEADGAFYGAVLPLHKRTA